jgi:hypothetical protein
MIHEADAAFLRDAQQFALRLTCPDCVHFEPERKACGEGYPNAEHLVSPSRLGQKFVFCKSFELY